MKRLGLLTVLTALLGAGSFDAKANEYQQEWERLHAALLTESVDGDLAGAIETFEALAGRLSANSETGPILAEALFQLGYAYVKQGDTGRARAKLRECLRVSGSGRCRHLLSKIALDENAIDALPKRWEFGDNDHGFVLIPGAGSVRVSGNTNGNWLKWALPEGVNPDALAFSIRPEALPAKRARFVAYLQRSERIVYPVIEDKYGSRFTLKRGPLEFTDTPREYELNFRDFVGLEDPSLTLNPDDFYRLEFHERTLPNAQSNPSSTLIIDWFEVL